MGGLHEFDTFWAHSRFTLGYRSSKLRFLFRLTLEVAIHLRIVAFKSVDVGHELVLSVSIKRPV